MSSAEADLLTPRRAYRSLSFAIGLKLRQSRGVARGHPPIAGSAAKQPRAPLVVGLRPHQKLPLAPLLGDLLLQASPHVRRQPLQGLGAQPQERIAASLPPERIETPHQGIA